MKSRKQTFQLRIRLKEAQNNMVLTLAEFWFILIGVLFVGFIFLEGFDFGVGMSTQFLAKDEDDRRTLIQTIGPVWDANEVWLITAAGAMFAAFPHWYASIFSGYYLVFVLLLLALILRGVSFEFREKGDTKRWRYNWDWALFTGSIVPPFIFGVLFTSLIQGMPIDAEMNVFAGFTDYFNIFTILGGLAFVLLSYLHGLYYIGLKTVGELRQRAFKQAKVVYMITGLVLVGFIVMMKLDSAAFDVHGGLLIWVYVAIVAIYGVLFFFMNKQREGWSFIMTGLVLILVMTSFFVALFPNVMISSIDPAFNLSIAEAASGDYSLKVMTYVALTLVPVVLAYTIWSYYVFRKRVTGERQA